MAENEIDTLEIAVEAEAGKANRSLTGLEKRLNRVADSIEKIMVMLNGGLSFKNVDIDKLFSGDAMNRSAKKAGKELADNLIKGFNLDRAGNDVQRQVKDLTSKISKGLSANSGKPYAGLNKDIDSLGKITARNGSIAKTTSDEYQSLYETIRAIGKIKVRPETAKSLGDFYKERSGILKQKMSTSSGTELDTIYQGLQKEFPSIFKGANNVEDEFHQLNNALKEFYDTSKSFYKPEWLEDSAYESVASGINDIVEATQKAAKESTDLAASMREIEDNGKSFSELFGAGIDTSGLERAVSLTRNLNGSTTNESKYPELPFSDINKKFSRSTFDLDFSGMGANELRKQLNSYERSYKKIKQGVSDRIELEGTDTLGGKDWYKQIMQLNQYENAVDAATEALERYINVNEEANARIDRQGPSDTSYDGSVGKNDQSRYMGYDSDLMKAVYGDEAKDISDWNDAVSKLGNNAGWALNEIKSVGNNLSNSFNAEKVVTYTARIKELDAELERLSSLGLSEGDPQYDRVFRMRTELVEARKAYEKEMKKSVKADFEADEAKKAANAMYNATKKANLFHSALSKLGSSKNGINSIKKSVDNMGKSLRNARDLANKALHPIKSIKKLMGSDDGGKNGMGLGRMIGSSIMFSSIFGAISKIKEAVKAGSDNLVQYSSEYNKSISGMVSSLLYLKNSWAVAFAPIVNVVSPYIQKFIDMLASALNAVGQFMASLTGKGTVVQAKKAWTDYGKTLSNTGSSAKKAGNDAKKAAKDFQTYTLGIDELNIQPKTSDSSSESDSGSSGSYTGPSPSEMFETVEVSQPMSSLADKFKEAIKNSDFTDIGRMISDKLSNSLESINWRKAYKCADNFGKDLATFLNGLITPRLFYDLGSTVANSINTAFHSANSFAINFDWSNFGTSLANSIKGFFENWDAGLTAETFSNFGKGFLEGITSFVKSLSKDETWQTIGQDIADFICNIDYAGLAWDMINFAEAAAEAMVKWPSDLIIGVAKGILKNILGDKFTDEAEKRFDELVKPFQDGIEKFLGNLNPITKSLELVDAITGIFSKSGDSVVDGEKENWNGIMKIFAVAPQFFSDIFTAAQKLIKKASDFFGPWFGQKWSDIKKKFDMDKVKEYFRAGFQKAFDSVKSIWNGIGNFFKGVANKIVSPIGDAVNGIIDGINWVLDKLNSDTKLKKWDVPKFASGSDGIRRDTIGMVNDQSGSTYREMIVPPNGEAFIPEGRNVVLPLEKGTKIMPADQTKTFVNGMPHFAKGIGDFFGGAWEKAKDIAGTVADYVTHPDKLLQIALNRFVDFSNLLSPMSDIAGGIVKKIFGSAKDFISKIFSSSEAGNISYNVSAGVEQWRDLAKKALEITNQYSESNLNALLMQMQHESGGNPNAINNWDSNAKKGIPSKGLMQVIDPTFRSNALPGYNTNIYDPLSNMIAAIRYTVGRYGSLHAGWTARGYKGYASGIGKINLSDVIPKFVNGGFPEDGIFMANHEEMVGRFSNGRTAVANNDQIVDGISQGVYEAMIRAQSENTRETALLQELIEAVKRGSRIVVDGRELVNAYDNRKNRNGYSFT